MIQSPMFGSKRSTRGSAEARMSAREFRIEGIQARIASTAKAHRDEITYWRDDVVGPEAPLFSRGCCGQVYLEIENLTEAEIDAAYAAAIEEDIEEAEREQERSEYLNWLNDRKWLDEQERSKSSWADEEDEDEGESAFLPQVSLAEAYDIFGGDGFVVIEDPSQEPN